MQQYFVKGKIQEKQTIVLDDAQQHHILHVLRMKQGDQIRIADEAKQVFLADIVIQDGSVQALVKNRLESVINKVDITLALALIKGERWDYAIQKCCELGVSRIVPLLTSRCVVKAKQQDMDKKLIRWNKIALAACEQCKRSDLVTVSAPSTLAQCMKLDADVKLFAYEHANHQSERLWNILPSAANVKSILCVIGPEGGFTKEEADQLLQHAFLSASLGPRILRAETAAISAVNLLSVYYEN